MRTRPHVEQFLNKMEDLLKTHFHERDRLTRRRGATTDDWHITLGKVPRQGDMSVCSEWTISGLDLSKYILTPLGRRRCLHSNDRQETSTHLSPTLQSPIHQNNYPRTLKGRKTGPLPKGKEPKPILGVSYIVDRQTYDSTQAVHSLLSVKEYIATSPNDRTNKYKHSPYIEPRYY